MLSSHRTLPHERPGGMQVADGNGERVGGVHGLRRSGKIEKAGHHMLDLLLLGASITDDRRFDGEGRIFGNFQASRGGSEHGNAANLA